MLTAAAKVQPGPRSVDQTRTTSDRSSNLSAKHARRFPRDSLLFSVRGCRPETPDFRIRSDDNPGEDSPVDCGPPSGKDPP
jgi:hypothetical protein